MGQSIIDRIQAKLELFRLEKRYTRHRHRRSTFVSNAIYVDGEYIYQVPNSTGSSAESTATRIDALHGERAIAVTAAKRNHAARAAAVASNTNASLPTSSTSNVPASDKRLNRYSSMPGFGGSLFSGERPRVVERCTSMIR